MKKKELEAENKILGELVVKLGDSLINTIEKLQKMRSLVESQNKVMSAQNTMIRELQSALDTYKEKK